MARPPKDPATLVDGQYCVTAAVAAQMCNTTVNTLIRWRKSLNPPPYNEKLELYPVLELGDWIRLEQVYKTSKGGKYPWKPDWNRFSRNPGDVDPTYAPDPVDILPGLEPDKPKETHKARLERLKADKLEMELQEKAGTLVPADDVRIAMSSMVSRVKSRLLGIPSSVAPLLTKTMKASAVETIISDKVIVALEELSGDWRSEIEADDGGV